MIQKNGALYVEKWILGIYLQIEWINEGFLPQTLGAKRLHICIIYQRRKHFSGINHVHHGRVLTLRLNVFLIWNQETVFASSCLSKFSFRSLIFKFSGFTNHSIYSNYPKMVLLLYKLDCELARCRDDLSTWSTEVENFSE